QNKNPSSPKRVHFIDPVILLTKEDEPKEEDIIEPNATKGDDHSITVRTEEEVKEESEEFDEETKDGEEDDPEYFDTFATIEELSNHEWLLKNPRPSWVNTMTRLAYDKDEGTVTFEKDKENITFKMPHKMERFKHIDKDILKTDNIPSFIITGDDDDQENTYYSNSLKLGPHIGMTRAISVSTADVYNAKKFATVEDFALLHEDKIYSESKTRVCYV
nr:hypothetical protein [Tanacetum cinerariifolium]